MQYFGDDGLGSTRQLYDYAGRIIANERYDPFGNVINASGAGKSVYGFTGEQTDATGLVYLRARYYDPTTGRFISRDPFPGFLSAPQTQNGFVYVGNNPVRYRDPSGRIAPIIAAGLFACGGGALAGWAGTGIGDYIQWQGNKWSNWETYVGNVTGGCVAGVAALGGNIVLGNGAGGVVASVVRQSLEIAFEHKCISALDFASDVAYEGLVWGGTAWAGGKIGGAVKGVVQRILGGASANSTVTLYRAVGENELKDVIRFADYGLSPHGGGKYFALTEEGARSFADAPFNAGRRMTITKIDVPAEFLQRGYQFLDVGGAGTSIHFADEVLFDLYEVASRVVLVK